MKSTQFNFTNWVPYALLDQTAKLAADALAAKVKKNPAAHDFQIALVGLKWEIVDMRANTNGLQRSETNVGQAIALARD